MTGFQTVDFEVIASVDFSTSKFLKPVGFISKSGRHFQIPFCQPTDFASIPSAFWGAPLFLIPFGWWCLPAGIHDSAFQNLLEEVMPDGTIQLAKIQTEAECNDLILEAMQSIKPNPTIFEKAQMDAIYEGVTLGGWHAFKQDRS